MKRLSIKDFTNKELVDAIARWVESDPNLKPFEIGSRLRSGDWLEFYNDQIAHEVTPHYNS